MVQDDFTTLFEVAKASNTSEVQSSSPLERNQAVTAMTVGGMSDLEIARHVGMIREEIRLIVKTVQRLNGSGEV
jgi:hypothetical protein